MAEQNFHGIFLAMLCAVLAMLCAVIFYLKQKQAILRILLRRYRVNYE